MRNLFVTLLLLVCAASLSAQHLRILSYNIHHGNPPATPGKIDLEAIAAVIKSSKADLVGLQEVDIRVSRSNMVDQAKELAEMTGMSYFFSKGIDLERGEYGTLILTKHKIVGNRRYDLPMVVPSENRSLAIIDVELPGGKIVSFANTHLDLKQENRLAQANYITELGDWYDRPLILVGDLNARPDSESIRVLEGYFQRNTTSNGPTSPNTEAKNEIDYIMVGKHTKFSWKTYKTLPELSASDHLPVFAEIVIH
ncbi:endonuclease/exonuclease/phosphatase family metal-dependent hydrolase [Sphingobacterium allocomposti]|uniref:Endonuclease/exonuclease/phosphatase family metal-dependent hydrolase n=1 Tax=Sphingobacterium allocomposti TaxID=415956 RepID=A0A5S5D3S6_9SPHI|nr:endonuclease/exonuclease/phosphatase family protein [Sphingobacterium composti Yoo et al. 2007 non Ten et al. 2007]TYP90044.1 endonuclease/exonuclease/phosphatase family metal-dependent hydrolase [Sphingobacterium composti Yoo et al. 2007 non Ten et al. 2007]